jgi:hypothetical protein
MPDMVREAYGRAGLDARVEPFLDAMDREMAAADLVVSRAGATTLAELTAAGRPAVLVPLPTATDDHQRKNAEALARPAPRGDRAAGADGRASGGERAGAAGDPTGAARWPRPRRAAHPTRPA